MIRTLIRRWRGRADPWPDLPAPVDPWPDAPLWPDGTPAAVLLAHQPHPVDPRSHRRRGVPR